MNAKPNYNDTVKKVDENKVFQDFKKPSQMMVQDYVAIPDKSSWNSNIEYSFHSINKESMDAPTGLCHLLMHAAFKLQIFGDDAHRKLSTRCKVAANVVSNLLERNTVFLSDGSVKTRLPSYVCPKNQETFKSAVVELLICTNDTNVQHHYIGDGEGKLGSEFHLQL